MDTGDVPLDEDGGATPVGPAYSPVERPKDPKDATYFRRLLGCQR